MDNLVTIIKTVNTCSIYVLLTANNVQRTMCNVRHDVKDTLLNIPLLTKGKKNLKLIATNRN